MDSILHGEWPKADVCVFWPMQCGVDEHGAGPFGDGADGAFSHPILVVGTNAREGLVLMLLSDIGEPFLAGEDAIVAMILLDGDPHGSGCAFEEGFALNAFPSAKGDLRAEEDVSAGVVNADETSGEFLGVILAAAGVWETPFGTTDEVVNRNAIAWVEVVLADGHLLRGDCGREVGLVSTRSGQLT